MCLYGVIASLAGRDGSGIHRSRHCGGKANGTAAEHHKLDTHVRRVELGAHVEIPSN